MNRVVAAIASIAFVAGCLGTGEESRNGILPEAPPLVVHRGEWRAFEATVGEAGLFSASLKWNVTMDDLPVNQDSYECVAAYGGRGWFAIGPTTYGPRPYVAHSEEGRRLYVTPDTGHYETRGSQLLFGNLLGEIPKFVVVHVATPYVSSEVHWELRAGSLEPGLAGGAWCLRGIWGYHVGEYIATSDYVQASGLAWTQDFRHGVLVRVLSRDVAWTARMASPDSASVETVEGGFDSEDWTFCSTQAGEWTWTVETLRSQAVGDWSFLVIVQDIKGVPFECSPGWHRSPIAEFFADSTGKDLV